MAEKKKGGITAWSQPKWFVVMCHKACPDDKRPGAAAFMRCFTTKEEATEYAFQTFSAFIMEETPGEFAEDFEAWSEEFFSDSYMDMRPIELTILNVQTQQEEVVSNKQMYKRFLGMK